MGVYICQGCGEEQPSWEGKCPRCGSGEMITLAPKTDPMIGKVLDGRYQIVRKLGQGGMGAVYLAESIGIGQRVALKFLKSEFSQDPGIVKRFRTEAKSYALVEHPNAVMLHDFRQDEEGNLYIAMEFCEGQDLKKVLTDQRQLPLADAVEIALQTADVLGYAHSKGVVHRDLKPENIMIRRGMRGLHVKVLDFGIARLTGSSTQLTVAGSIAGTPRYMAPEQVEGKPVDQRVDVYALGVVLFELLTGVQPFDGDTISQILHAQVVTPTPHLTEIDPRLELPGVDAIIQRATAKDREQRFADMGAFAAALSSLDPGSAPLTVPRPVPEGDPDLGGTLIRRRATPYPPTERVPAEATRPDAAATVPNPAITLGVGGRVSGMADLAPADELTQLERRSSGRGKLIAGGVALAVVAGMGLVVMSKSPPSPPGPAVEVAPVPLSRPAPPPPLVGPSVNHQRAAESLAWAQDHFKAGKLSIARTYLDSVPEDAAVAPRAAELKAAIAELEKKLAEAERLVGRGECVAAIRVFDEILKANPAIGEASVGRARCKQAEPPTTLE